MAVTKGIRTRTSPDWYARYVSTGALQVLNGPNTHFQYISLYNNSTSGQFLFVHWLMCVAAVSSALLFYFRQGTQGGFTSNCVRINPSQPAPAGQMYILDNDTSPIPDPIIGLQSTFTGGAIAGGAPIFIVPPGWSLLAGPTVADSAPGLSVQYIPYADQDGKQAV
jgi:hypothetical protein